MSGHIVFVRFFPGRTEQFPFDRFVRLKHGDIGDAIESFCKEWNSESANRQRLRAARAEWEQQRLESEQRREVWSRAGLARPTGRRNPSDRVGEPNADKPRGGRGEATPPQQTPEVVRERVVPTGTGVEAGARYESDTAGPPDESERAASIAPNATVRSSGPATFEEIAITCGWGANPFDLQDWPYGISDHFPVARFDHYRQTEAAAAALQRRVVELARATAQKSRWVGGDNWIVQACPRFAAVAETELSLDELVTAGEQLQRINGPVATHPSIEEALLRAFWPELLPTLEQVQKVAGAGPLPEPPFARLKALAEELALTGHEVRIVEMICAGSGKVTLGDLTLKLGWANPPGNWNSARQRLNRKLKKRGWVLNTIGNCAVATERPAAGRK